MDLADASQDELIKMRENAEKLDTMMSMACAFIGESCRAPSLPPRNGAGERASGTASPPAARSAELSCSPIRACKSMPAMVGMGAEAGSMQQAGRPAASAADDDDDDDSEGSADGGSGRRRAGSVPGAPAGKIARSLVRSSPSSALSLSSLDDPRSPAEAVFEALVSSFRHSVLPTYKCRCVQFLLFFACSHDEAYARAFLQLMLSQLRSEHVHAEARVACTA